MRPYLVRGLRLERCGDCGKVWLELDEVSRLYGPVHAELSVEELDQPCPNDHGPLMKAKLKGSDAAVCPVCRGALVGAYLRNLAGAPPDPRPERAQLQVQSQCEHCRDWVPATEITHTIRGAVCRRCALVEEPTSGRGDTETDWSTALQIADALLQLIFVILG
jgi:hypothetical protein